MKIPRSVQIKNAKYKLYFPSVQICIFSNQLNITILQIKILHIQIIQKKTAKFRGTEKKGKGKLTAQVLKI